MRSFYFLALLLIPQVVFGALASRQHSDTIVEDKLVVGSDVADELDHLVGVINTLDSANVADGTIVAADAAATSSLFSADRKLGCNIERITAISGLKTIQINPPCELVIDGIRGVLSATTSVNMIDDLEGTLSTSTFYYVYGNVDAGVLTFEVSENEPVVGTARKSTDSTYKYIGTVRTQDATQDLAQFRQVGNQFFLEPIDATEVDGIVTGLVATPPTGGVAAGTDQTLSVPRHIREVWLKWTAFFDASYPAHCAFYLQNDIEPYFNAIAAGTGSQSGFIPKPVPVQLDGALVELNDVAIENIANCTQGGNVRVRGWVDPPYFHK